MSCIIGTILRLRSDITSDSDVNKMYIKYRVNRKVKMISFLKEGRTLDGRFNEGLLEETWFHGEISCDEAEARLALAKAGSFLVRNVGILYIFSIVVLSSHPAQIHKVFALPK